LRCQQVWKRQAQHQEAAYLLLNSIATGTNESNHVIPTKTLLFSILLPFRHQMLPLILLDSLDRFQQQKTATHIRCTNGTFMALVADGEEINSLS